MCLNIETPNNYHFPSGTNGKIVVLSVPILSDYRVFQTMKPFHANQNDMKNFSIIVSAILKRVDCTT